MSNLPPEVEKTIVGEYNKILGEIKSLISARPTHTIYHYTSAQGLEGILRHSNIWFTRWDCLNDSSEYLQIHDIIRECIEQYRNTPPFYEAVKNWNELSRKEKQEQFYKEPYLDLYIASFSSKGDALNMWTYYTKSGSSDGYCVGVNSMNIFKDKKVDLSIHQVIYNDSEKRKIIMGILDKIFQFYNFIKHQPSPAPLIAGLYVSDYINIACSYIGCFFKHSSFAVENEIRASLFIRDEDGYKELEKKHRVSHGIIIPYTELHFHKEDIKSVTISPTLPQHEAESGLRFLQHQLGYNFTIKHSTIPFRNI